MCDAGMGRERRHMDRRAFLWHASAGVVALGGAVLACGGQPTQALQLDNEPKLLAHLDAPRACLFGALLWPSAIPSVGQLAVDVCDVLVMADGVYWDSMERKQGAMDFSHSERVCGYAIANGKLVRGHPLVWHRLIPKWVDDAMRVLRPQAVLDGHVEAIVSRFAGRVRYWDVVNEAVAPEDGEPTGLRKSLWLEHIGPSYVANAFRTAHRADPEAALGYNEYFIEDDSRRADTKRAAVLQLLRELKRINVPITYLGIQAHLSAEQTFSNEKLGAFLRSVEGLGLDIQITELDVNDRNLAADIPSRDAAVAETYARFLDVVLANSRPTVVSTWGIRDDYSWQHREHPRGDGLPQRPLPFDAMGEPKPAWDVLVERGIAPAYPRAVLPPGSLRQ